MDLARAEPCAPAPEAGPDPEHAALVREVLGLQRGLEEINQKIAAKRAERAELMRENEGLAEYIDHLMVTVNQMGSKIVASRGSPGLRRLLPSRKGRAVRVNEHVGELQSRPARQLMARRLSGSFSPMKARPAGSGPTTATAPVVCSASDAAAPLRLGAGASMMSPPPPPPPPRPPKEGQGQSNTSDVAAPISLSAPAATSIGNLPLQLPSAACHSSNSAAPMVALQHEQQADNDLNLRNRPTTTGRDTHQPPPPPPPRPHL